MSKELPQKVALTAFATLCEGSAGIQSAPLRSKPAHATVAVYNDGSRDVGCGYLNKETGNCMGNTTKDVLCIQLFPGTQDTKNITPGLESQTEAKEYTGRQYSTHATTVDGRRVGLWRGEDNKTHAEFLPDNHRGTFRRELVDPIGPNSPYWNELHPQDDSNN